MNAADCEAAATPGSTLYLTEANGGVANVPAPQFSSMGEPIYVGVGGGAPPTEPNPAGCYQVQTVGGAYSIGQIMHQETNFPQFHETCTSFDTNVYKACVCKRVRPKAKACKCVAKTPSPPPFPPPPLPLAPPPSPPPQYVIEDECAALPDVNALGGELDGKCNSFCDVWNGDDRAGDYAAVDALFNSGFGRGEVVVFQADNALLSAGCGPEIPMAEFAWAGNGGWLRFQLSAGIPVTDLMVIDTYSTDATTGSAFAYGIMEHRAAGGLAAGGADCTLSFTNPRVCRAAPGAVAPLGEEANLPCTLIGPYDRTTVSTPCSKTGKYNTLVAAIENLEANQRIGDATVFYSRREGDAEDAEFGL